MPASASIPVFRLMKSSAALYFLMKPSTSAAMPFPSAPTVKEVASPVAVRVKLRPSVASVTSLELR